MATVSHTTGRLIQTVPDVTFTQFRSISQKSPEHRLFTVDDIAKSELRERAFALKDKPLISEETGLVLSATVMQVAFIALGIAHPPLVILAVFLYAVFATASSSQAGNAVLRNFQDTHQGKIPLWMELATVISALVPGGVLMLHGIELASRGRRLEGALGNREMIQPALQIRDDGLGEDLLKTEEELVALPLKWDASSQEDPLNPENLLVINDNDEGFLSRPGSDISIELNKE